MVSQKNVQQQRPINLLLATKELAHIVNYLKGFKIMKKILLRFHREVMAGLGIVHIIWISFMRSNTHGAIISQKLTKLIAF
jgi:hypothetical protein